MAYVELGAPNASLQAEVAKRKTLKEGASGSEVALAQTFLNHWRAVYKKGPMLPLNSQFDASFKSAVKSFQRDVGLSVDGSIGPNTWAALISQKKPVSAPSASSAPSVPLSLPRRGFPSWIPLAAAGVGLAFLLTSKK